MNRCLAFLFALLLTSLSVASACTAQGGDWVRFSLDGRHRASGDIQASFRTDRQGKNDSNWSTGFPPSQLLGLDVVGFRSAGTRPLRFAVAREAGRLDCSGQGGNSYASGDCSFAANPGFAQLLESRGIGRPTREQAFSLMAVDARRDVIDAVAAARYRTPTINQLIELAALEVTGNYVRGLAQVGYRPKSLSSLVEFKALGITPEYIGGFVRSGYANMDPDDLVQLRAMNITPDYIAGFEQLGYRHIPVDKLVQLKALDITPEFVRAVQRDPGTVPPVGDLVNLKIFQGAN